MTEESLVTVSSRGESEAARYGARSVGVPGEVAGYWEAKLR